MPCYYPLKAYRSRDRDPGTGRYGITFNPVKSLVEGSHLILPCGRCSGCRLERSRQWAVRCMHEAQLYDQNTYITLTFSDEHLPKDFSVDVRDWQLFAKKLRKHTPQKIRSFACGEYGDKSLRPHYHAILFNKDFSDKQFWKYNKRGEPLFTSPTLTKIWGLGHCTIGAVTFESAAYVAQYCMKKFANSDPDKVAEHYTRLHPITKTLHVVRPEFVTQSRRPGLGAPWLERFKSDVYPSDFIVARNMKMAPPRFYDQRLTEEELEELKRRRKATGLRYRADQTPERLKARETVHKAKMSIRTRNVED